MRFFPLITFTFLLLFNSLNAQEQKSSAEIYEELEKFNFLGSVLYLAAHPDDENTRLISYLSNGLNARTAYLSLTRGDGGQNLIGTEIRELLGVIRSQELQMARSIDGGQQFFTRANDFGYSKHPDETLKIWNKSQVFEDVIYTIRSFKPDIIINRFDHRTPGKSHGHHTSSAMLSVEAFDKSNDPSIYPKQLKTLEPWQVRRQFFNTSWWFYGGRDKFAEADKSNLVSLDVGAYYPTLGISNNEISALARSKHRSQGFGSSGDRGSYQEYLEIINGDLPMDKTNLFDGIETTWLRIDVGNQIKPIMESVMATYDFKDPSAIVPDLLKVHDILSTSKDAHWRDIKLNQISELIIACMGLHLEASTDRQQTTIGDSLEVMIEWTNRSQVPVTADEITINELIKEVNRKLEPFTTEKIYINYYIDKDLGFSNPYWLKEKGTLGTYKVSDPKIRNHPESQALVSAKFDLTVDGRELIIERDVQYRYVNPAAGEIREPLAVIPPATISFEKDLYLFSSNNEQSIEVKVRAGKDNLKGTLKIEVPEGWAISPDDQNVEIAKKGLEASYAFKLISPEDISEGQLRASILVDGSAFDKTLINIDYDHIPLQTVLSPSEAKAVKVPLSRGGTKIGYVMGAGDKIPESLANVGYRVTEIDPASLPDMALNRFDAIVIGIRAYNAVKNLKLYNEVLFSYAENGGTLITQYNTSRRLNFDDLSPYPIKLSRKRVTDEFAPMRVLIPQHQVMNVPNKISSSDFEGWVQERGLYFPEEWDDQFEAIVSSNDLGEDPLDGSLLIAPHGKGYFVYTSLSWFRQLPAGVPGAYRLFANMLALSSKNHDKP
ncbi:MAG: PIG-L family deacetylase [Bacteroidia bacterium]|nr:PIG-L family deacetylase [Bacteroidia bacterium]